MRKIKNALVSVFHKEGLEEILKTLNQLGVELYSTGGTYKYIEDLGVKAHKVEDLTTYPSILGGRVKTLHPKVFGGILARREIQEDLRQLDSYEIPQFDLVIVDLYPFEETLASTNDESTIIEKIDIGGISLIRAAAKNYKDVLILPAADLYPNFLELLKEKKAETALEDRKFYAAQAFAVSSNYDTAIFNYFNADANIDGIRISEDKSKVLRYGENPHQKGYFYGDMEKVFDKLNGKEISYNNILDIDAAIRLISDFEETTFAVMKHNNACGIASRDTVLESWNKALEGDPISAFGGVLVCNRAIDLETAQEIDKLFYEVLIAPEFNDDALALLSKKKTRILLKLKNSAFAKDTVRTALNGYLKQDADAKIESEADMNVVTKVAPKDTEYRDLIFANKVVKHTKSNAMVIVRDEQLIASGVGETSRVDAFKQAIEKAGNFKKEIKGAVLASDAFFPFPDNVEIAHSVGINAVVQPGGSKKDQLSIDYCDKNGMAMCFTGIRHFKH
jgi:phosphoribosylaminoimidazolecarboxamide formyltransferase/IMP cyclohydrolase